MSDFSSLVGFDGKVRLFPLPNLVLFPHVLQPLHIFEPRYRQMTQDALDDDRLIAMVLPRPGWESDYGGAPAIHSVACLGRIISDHRLPDGRFNLLLRGLARLRIEHEIPSDKLYRIAQCSILDDERLLDEEIAARWRQLLIERAPAWFQQTSDATQQLKKLLHSDLSLDALSDILTFALPLDAEFKQTLLAELSVQTRIKTLHDFLESKKAIEEASQRHFPPEFSAN